MKKYAIWKNHKVIGYIELTEEQRQLLNGIPGRTLQRSMQKLYKQAKIKLTKHNL